MENKVQNQKTFPHAALSGKFYFNCVGLLALQKVEVSVTFLHLM